MRPLFLMGHSRPLTWVAFNRDGDLLFTCGKDARLAVWNADNGERIALLYSLEKCVAVFEKVFIHRHGTYDVGKGVVWNCDCTLDSRRLVCASADQRIMVFDVLTGATLHDIQEEGPCKFVEWNRKPDEQNKFVLAHDSFGTQASKAIKVWQLDGPNGKPRRLWAQDDYSGRCVQVRWGPFDQTIISCHENGDIMIWNAETGEYINEFRAHKQFITCLSFSEDRLLMLSCCSDGTAKLWDTVDFNCIKNYQTDRPLNACDISPRFNKTGEERRCHILLGGGQAAEEVTTTASGEGKFEALLYHLVYQEELGSCKGHFGPLNTLAWRPDGGGYASGGEDGYVRIYHFDEEYFTDKFEP